MNNSGYIINKLKDTLYSERHKGDIIKLIQLAIESFNDSYKKVDGTVNWRTNVDEDLAKHLLIMFEKTKHINVRQMNQDQFKRLYYGKLMAMAGELPSFIIN